jgi:hypothetical protein
MVKWAVQSAAVGVLFLRSQDEEGWVVGPRPRQAERSEVTKWREKKKENPLEQEGRRGEEEGEIKGNGKGSINPQTNTNEAEKKEGKSNRIKKENEERKTHP